MEDQEFLHAFGAQYFMCKLGLQQKLLYLSHHKLYYICP